MLSLPATEVPTAQGDAVVDISALDAHLARRSGEAPPDLSETDVAEVRGSSRRRAAVGRGPAGRRGSRRTPQAAPEEAVVDLDAVDSWFSRGPERGGG